MGLGTILVTSQDWGSRPNRWWTKLTTWWSTNLIWNRYRNRIIPTINLHHIGAMIDFGPLLQNPFMLLRCGSSIWYFLRSSCSRIIRIWHSWSSFNRYHRCGWRSYINLRCEPISPSITWAITVAAYSYMALVPIIQPIAIKMVTTKADVVFVWHTTLQAYLN